MISITGGLPAAAVAARSAAAAPPARRFSVKTGIPRALRPSPRRSHPGSAPPARSPQRRAGGRLRRGRAQLAVLAYSGPVALPTPAGASRALAAATPYAAPRAVRRHPPARRARPLQPATSRTPSVPTTSSAPPRAPKPAAAPKPAVGSAVPPAAGRQRAAAPVPAVPIASRPGVHLARIVLPAAALPGKPRIVLPAADLPGKPRISQPAPAAQSALPTAKAPLPARRSGQARPAGGTPPVLVPEAVPPRPPAPGPGVATGSGSPATSRATAGEDVFYPGWMVAPSGVAQGPNGLQSSRWRVRPPVRIARPMVLTVSRGVGAWRARFDVHSQDGAWLAAAFSEPARLAAVALHHGQPLQQVDIYAGTGGGGSGGQAGQGGAAYALRDTGSGPPLRLPTEMEPSIAPEGAGVDFRV